MSIQEAIETAKQKKVDRRERRVKALDCAWCRVAPNDVIRLWNEIAIEQTGHTRFQASFASKAQAALTRKRMGSMAESTNEAPKDFLTDLFVFCLTQWYTLRRAPATQWMVTKRNILPDTPNFQFVIFQWQSLRQAFTDHNPRLEMESNPRIADLEQENDQLRRASARPGTDGALADTIERLAQANTKLKQENHKLRRELGVYQAKDPDFLDKD